MHSVFSFCAPFSTHRRLLVTCNLLHTIIMERYKYRLLLLCPKYSMSVRFANKNTQKWTNFHNIFCSIAVVVFADEFTNLVSWTVNMNAITTFGFETRLQCCVVFFSKMSNRILHALRMLPNNKHIGNEAHFCRKQFLNINNQSWGITKLKRTKSYWNTF